MTPNGVILALGLFCLARCSFILGHESPEATALQTLPAEAAANSHRPTPDAAAARSKPLYVVGLVPPSPDAAVQTNQVPDPSARTFLGKLLESASVPQVEKREAEPQHHDGQEPHAKEHDHDHDHSTHDHSKDPKSRKKRAYCSRCGGQQLGYGGGYGGGGYGGGGYGGGYQQQSYGGYGGYGGGGGCGGSCGGGGSYIARPVYRPVYQQSYQQPSYGGGGVCSVCGQPLSSGGAYYGGYGKK